MMNAFVGSFILIFKTNIKMQNLVAEINISKYIFKILF